MNIYETIIFGIAGVGATCVLIATTAIGIVMYYCIYQTDTGAFYGIMACYALVVITALILILRIVTGGKKEK